MRAGEAARLLCAGLSVVTGGNAVSAGKVLGAVLSLGAPAITKAVSIPAPQGQGPHSPQRHVY